MGAHSPQPPPPVRPAPPVELANLRKQMEAEVSRLERDKELVAQNRALAEQEAQAARRSVQAAREEAERLQREKVGWSPGPRGRGGVQGVPAKPLGRRALRSLPCRSSPVAALGRGKPDLELTAATPGPVMHSCTCLKTLF